MRVLFLCLALLVASCERERFWKMDGDVLVVDNHAPLLSGAVLRCIESAGNEYLCERVASDGRLIQRGYFVRTSRDTTGELRQRLGHPLEPVVKAEWILDQSTNLILTFSDYRALDGNRRIVRFMLPEYASWLTSQGSDPFPHPLEPTLIEASIRRVILERCGDDLPVHVSAAPDGVYADVPGAPGGSYSGSAGTLALRSYDGVYWEAVGVCSAVEANRGGRRIVP